MGEGSYLSWVQQNFKVYRLSGDEAMTNCPFHEDSTPSFQINVKTGLYICFGCGASGGPQGLSTKLAITAPPDEIDLDGLWKDLEEVMREEEEAPILPESYLERFRVPNSFWDLRGLRKPSRHLWKLGYDPLTDSATIPVRDHKHRLHGVIRRRVGGGWPKYVYPTHFDLKNTLFGSWAIKSPRIALAEGSIDAMKLVQAGVPAVAQLGSTLHEGQVQVLREMNVHEVVLWYDNDPAGRNAIEKAVPLLHDFLVWVIQWRSGAKDPGALNDEGIRLQWRYKDLAS